MTALLIWAIGNQGPVSAVLLVGTGLTSIGVTMAGVGIAALAGRWWP